MLTILFESYTAVTCGVGPFVPPLLSYKSLILRRLQPEEFEANRFGLRPVMLNRETELMVVITLYNVRSSSPLQNIR